MCKVILESQLNPQFGYNGKLLGSPGLQGQHAYLVVRPNKKKTSIKNLMA